MSASDPFSILNRDPNRGTYKEPAAKVTVKPLRAGHIPEWALQQHDPQETEFKKITLKVKGYTGDASGIIIDTEQGK